MPDSKYELITPEGLKDSKVLVYSVTGQLIVEVEVNQQSSVLIDLQENASGMYVVSLVKKNTLWGTSKLVK